MNTVTRVGGRKIGVTIVQCIPAFATGCRVFMLCNIAIPSNNFVKLSECSVILYYKLIIAQGNIIIVQDTT